MITCEDVRMIKDLSIMSAKFFIFQPLAVMKMAFVLCPLILIYGFAIFVNTGRLPSIDQLINPGKDVKDLHN
jgi:hypothetical protein